MQGTFLTSTPEALRFEKATEATKERWRYTKKEREQDTDKGRDEGKIIEVERFKISSLALPLSKNSHQIDTKT